MPYPTFLVASLQRARNKTRIVRDVLWGREHHNVCQIIVRVNSSKDKQTAPLARARCVSKSTHRSRKHAWCGPFFGPHVVQMEVIGHKGPPEQNKAQHRRKRQVLPLQIRIHRRRGFLMGLLPYCCSNKPQAWH